MPLHPQAAAFLEQLNALGLPAMHEMTPQGLRQQMRDGIPGLGPVENVANVEERTIGVTGGEITLRIYRPAGVASPAPATMFFHGGGWVVGDIDTHDCVCRAIANATPCVVIAPDYRLAPEHRYPTAANDAFEATQWVGDHAAELGLDHRRLAVAGDSAGGNLSAVVALMSKDRGARPLAAQVLIYPIIDYNLDTDSYHRFADGYWLTRLGMQWFWELYIPDEADRAQPYASPMRAADLSGLPRAYVITAGYDPLQDEGKAFAGTLRAAGVPTTLKHYPDQFHGFVRRLNDFDDARGCIRKIAAELNDAFAACR